MEPQELFVSTDDMALATDLYELTMAAAYFKSGQTQRIGVFEAFVRKLPHNRSYIVAAGLEQVIHYLLNLKFTEQHIRYLKSNEAFHNVGEDFLNYLLDFRFSGDLWAVPEGTILFPNEPIVRVEAPIIEAQLVETFLLSNINFQSLIASKASRVTNAGRGTKVIEFGFRRAHGPQAALLAARASYIGGCYGTSNTLAGYRLGIPTFGTMAHSFVMNFESELEAFRAFGLVLPCGLLLVDTYDTLAAVEKIVKHSIQTSGIRLDSGDLYELSVKSRKILDDAGYKSTVIMASGDLDENIISVLVAKSAPIDIFGVGTELATSRDDPAMNGVYKLVAIRVKQPDNQKPAQVIYKLKTSTGKKTLPGPKQVYRTVDQNGIIKSDIVALDDEQAPENSLPLLRKYVSDGSLSADLPSLDEIQRYYRGQMRTLSEEFKRLDVTVEKFPVVYSNRLQAIAGQFHVAE